MAFTLVQLPLYRLCGQMIFYREKDTGGSMYCIIARIRNDKANQK